MRVPLLGMAIAMALLVVENLGALAYREHAIASVTVDVGDAAKRAAKHQQRKLLDRDASKAVARSSHCRE